MDQNSTQSDSNDALNNTDTVSNNTNTSSNNTNALSNNTNTLVATNATNDEKDKNSLLQPAGADLLLVAPDQPDLVQLSVEDQKVIDGRAHFKRLGWKRLTIVLIVEAIALGSLGLPQAFATLGMVTGIVLTIGIGLIAMYASWILGKVKLKYPDAKDYADLAYEVLGKWGKYCIGTMFVAQLVSLVASHCLTGTIAFVDISRISICSLIWGVVSAILLFALAIPRSFTEVAILGYVDFASIILAIGVTIVATAVQGSNPASEIALSPTWSAWPKENLSFPEAFISVNSIVFAYAFASAQPSFMDEMHTQKDYTKSIVTLGVFEIILYVFTGSLIYAFAGQDVQSPALLSAGPLWSRIVFGIALPVIFISGSINTTVVCRYMHKRLFADSVVQYVNTRKGWLTWIGFVGGTTIVAFIIANAIPFFSELLSISSSLFISGFSFYFPPVLWYCLLREGPWYSRKNLPTAMCNLVAFIVGIIVLVAGTYASIVQLVGPNITPSKFGALANLLSD
ncbi:hypothetical protein G7046_g5557 [Stylonectria norvegica]|nr:hypothetical protein G7046_g5557 [Stylonectria norvegica]